MIPAGILSGVEPVQTGKSILNPRGEALRLLPQLEPGQILSARVEGKLPDGSFKVLVAGQEMRMQLPSYIASGDRLQLRFLSSEPRPTFALTEVLPKVADTPLLSAAGRLVAAMMPVTGETAVLARTAAAAPLLAALPGDGASLSAALENKLVQSGLFYEAHQADWLSGKRDLAQLRAEPQASLTRIAPPAQALNDSATATALPAKIDSFSATTTLRTEQVIPPQGIPLVQQQLAALESGKFLLQLEIWPNQWMQWEIEEHGQQTGSDPDQPASWQTRLHLDLPQLGRIDAVVTLGGNAVQVKVDAASTTSAALLKEHRPALQAALSDAGVPPAAITIARHDTH